MSIIIYPCKYLTLVQLFIFYRYAQLAHFLIKQKKSIVAVTSITDERGGVSQSYHKRGTFVSRNRYRIIKMLIIIAVLFSVSWAPYFSILLKAVITIYIYIYMCVSLLQRDIRAIYGYK